jgi:type 1 glutamine amidotransferase
VSAVVWNNVSGDVLTRSQRKALRRFVEAGGGFVATHGAAGDIDYFWDWYRDTLIGARFIGHPLQPQFQDARVLRDDQAGAIGAGLPPSWTMRDE